MARAPDDAEVRRRLRELLERGDHRAGARLLAEAYGRRLHGFLWRFFSDPRDAEDVAQEVWIGVLKGLPAFRFEAAPRTWLFRVAMHKVADQRRARRSLVPLDSAVLSHLEGASSPGAAMPARARRPDEMHSLQGRRRRAAEVLERFSERDREVALLFLQGGLSAREVAEVVGLEEANTRQIKKKIIDALRGALEL